jgi:ssDNA thymidine ADP-ribosyltransferase, DarT
MRFWLLADSAEKGPVRECGQPSIKERRRSRQVPERHGGVVADYVPFYFAPRSPMLFSILGGRVKEYGTDQSQLVYLVTRLSRVIAHGLAWVATDRNAVLQPAKFTADRGRLAQHIDWAVMEAQYWGNTVDDGSRMQRRMAELLVHRAVPWSVISHVATCCEGRAAEVKGRLPATTPPRILVRPKWYFSLPDNCPCQRGWGQGGGEIHDH